MGKLITDHLFRRVEALEKRIEELEGKLRVEFSKIDPVYVLECHKPVKKPWKGKPRGTENPSSAEFRRLPNAPEKE